MVTDDTDHAWGIKSRRAKCQFPGETSGWCVQVETLLGRLQAAVPGMGIVGGVLQPGAWGGGHRSMRGAVFLGSEVYHEGAVGCILQGSVQLDTICTGGCR